MLLYVVYIKYIYIYIHIYLYLYICIYILYMYIYINMYICTLNAFELAAPSGLTALVIIYINK